MYTKTRKTYLDFVVHRLRNWLPDRQMNSLPDFCVSDRDYLFVGGQRTLGHESDLKQNREDYNF